MFRVPRTRAKNSKTQKELKLPLSQLIERKKGISYIQSSFCPAGPRLRYILILISIYNQLSGESQARGYTASSIYSHSRAAPLEPL